MMTDSAKLEDAVTGQPEYVLVPRVPTQGMLDAAFYSAVSEKAESVWEDMIKAWESSHEQGEIVQG